MPTGLSKREHSSLEMWTETFTASHVGRDGKLSPVCISQSDFFSSGLTSRMTIPFTRCLGPVMFQSSDLGEQGFGDIYIHTK